MTLGHQCDLPTTAPTSTTLRNGNEWTCSICGEIWQVRPLWMPRLNQTADYWAPRRNNLTEAKAAPA